MPSPAHVRPQAVRYLVRRTLTLAALTLVSAKLAAAQTPAPVQALPAPVDFTVDDVLDVRNASVGAVSDDGRWAVVTYGSLRDRIGTDNHRFGDPTYIAPSVAEVAVIDTRTGESRPLFPDRRQVRAFEFSPDGTRLAFMQRDGEAYQLALWEGGRVRTLALPRNRMLDPAGSISWTPDGQKLLLPLWSTQSYEAMRQRFEQEVKGPIVVQSSEEPFLSWEAIRRLGNRRILAVYDLRSSDVTELTDEMMAVQPALVGGGSAIRYNEDITKKTSYDVIFGTENRLVVQPLDGGEPRVLFDSIRGMSFVWSGDGNAYAYGKDGRIHFARLDGGEPRQIAGEAPRRDSAAAPPADSAARAAERERRARERFTPVELSETGDVLIASNRDGLWFIDTDDGERELFHRTRPEGTPAPAGDEEEESDTLPRWSVVAWSKDGDDVYLSYASRTAWERGVYRYERSSKQLRELLKDGRSYGGLTLSDDGTTFVLTVTEGNRPGDVYAADADFTNLRRLTDANPQLREKRLGTTELFDYLDADGEKLYGVLYYPPDYDASRRYPTVFIVYEQFFDDRFNSTVSLLNANGYVVVQPSVRLEEGYPGEAWVKGVTAAANELIRRGIADADRLGVHGTSYGGYAVNLLVTQTDRFAAAINISGKVDMISFYTDSPRLGVRNIHAPEKSQDRIGATLWEQPQKYIAQSAIMFADRIDTPLLLMTGAQDHNVPERTTMEMYYALRRLGKEVEWVSYVNGGHGMPTSTIEEAVDYHRRILDWYDKHLKKAKADGVAQN